MAKKNLFVTGMVAGAAVGAVAGLMLAPKTGKETRRIVSSRAREIRHQAGNFVGDLRQRIRRGENNAETYNVHAGDGN